MKAEPKLALIQKKGQVTIHAEIRKRYGLADGELVAIIEEEDGIKISPRRAVAIDALERIRQALEKSGVTLEAVLEAGEKIREDFYRETYGGKA